MDWETDDGLTCLWMYKHKRTELGAQTSYKDETEKSIVNGQHTAPALQQLLAKYIQGFVLCQNCGLPETSACVLAPLRPSLEFRSEWLLLSCAGGHTYLRTYVKHALTLLLPGVYTQKKTDYKIKGGVIYQKCDACGEKSMCDMQHKLTTFILNRYPKKQHKKALRALHALTMGGWMDDWMIEGPTHAGVCWTRASGQRTPTQTHTR